MSLARRKEMLSLGCGSTAGIVMGGVVGEGRGMEDYRFRVTGTFRKCLDRQIDEGLLITECEAAGGKILNLTVVKIHHRQDKTLFCRNSSTFEDCGLRLYFYQLTSK